LPGVNRLLLMHRFVIRRRKTMASTSSRVAVVTGGSRDIGRAVAERLGAEGFAVVVNYAGSKAEADAAVEAIESRGGRAIAVQADVADEVAVSAVFDAAEKTFGGVPPPTPATPPPRAVSKP
jgi:3-oxoacyl-[acyl-carrier protein] reductase